MVGEAPLRPCCSPRRGPSGYVFIILLFLLTVMAIGMMVAYPLWKTQMQREKEEELIFRGKQYVESIRLYQAKTPGKLPTSLQELFDKKFLRKVFADPMVKGGEWNVIMQSGTAAARPGAGGGRRGGALQEVLVAPASMVRSLNNPRILGVVSSSPDKSIRVYNEQESYDKWLFYFGQDPKKLPTIIYLNKKQDEAR